MGLKLENTSIQQLGRARKVVIDKDTTTIIDGAGDSEAIKARIKQLKAELLMIWGRQDPHVPLEGRLKVHAALSAAGTNFTWHEFNGAHAFLRDEGYRYDPELAHICLGLAVSLFRRKLGQGDLAVVAAVGTETKH